MVKYIYKNTIDELITANFTSISSNMTRENDRSGQLCPSSQVILLDLSMLPIFVEPIDSSYTSIYNIQLAIPFRYRRSRRIVSIQCQCSSCSEKNIENRFGKKQNFKENWQFIEATENARSEKRVRNSIIMIMIMCWDVRYAGSSLTHRYILLLHNNDIMYY